MIRTTARTARKPHECGGGCGGWIERGARYLEHVASPHHDGLGNEGWWTIPECGPCAARYGRPVPPIDPCHIRTLKEGNEP